MERTAWRSPFVPTSKVEKMASSQKSRKALLILSSAVSCLALEAHAQSANPDQAVVLSTVNVDALSAQTPDTVAAKNTPATVYEVGPTIIDILNPGGAANPYRAVSILPSVDAPALDPYGLSNIPGGNKGFRVRGELPQHGSSNITFDGVPLAGVNPGAGAQWLFATENIKAIELYQGPVASDVNSFFTNAGVVNSLLRWPETKPGAEFSQGFGSYNFLRSFSRVDTGLLFNGTTNAFVSGSWTDADNWRSPGKAANNNFNVAAGLHTQIEAFDAKLFFSYNSMRQNTLPALTYAQVKNLGANNYFGYSTSPFALANYYKNVRQNFNDWALLGEFTYALSDSAKIVLKPFYTNEQGNYWDPLANGRIRNWIIDHDWYGLTAEIQGRVADTDMKLGYWWTSLGLPGPPTAWRTYAPTTSGSLVGPMWMLLAQETSRNQFQSVYATMEKRLGDLRLEFGSRYVWNDMPGVNAYSGAGVGGLSYDAALAASPGVIAANSVTSHTTGAFLPFMAASYDLTSELQLRASAGANYGGPSYDAFPVYQTNAAAFAAKGITANQLWQQIKLETSAALDAGLRWTHEVSGLGVFSIEPTGYVSRNYNKGVTYDPGIGIQYAQNVGQSLAYGAQLLGRWKPIETLDIFASMSYDRNVFVSNLPVLAGASAATYAGANVTGTQLPDVPEWTAALGGTWRYGDFAFTPVANFTGSRWGDTTRTQYLSGYATVDLNFAYHFQLPAATLEASLTISNLLNAQYIGFINNSYFQQSSLTNAFYYPGAPRAVIGKIAMKL
ncbi:TonB-dependent receptor [Methylocella tundrae]|uniref:TonB-dependent receptor n=2 Tax=Methylocella tundrae TaxID=227605 RepID=A0A8B6MA45_METTU|nr:TonB-dependent receptor [Methylocella tundrae]